MKVILKDNNWVYMNDKLYLYDEESGCFKVSSKHDTCVLINYYLGGAKTGISKKKDILNIYHLLTIEPTIQYVGEVPDNQKYINLQNGVWDIEEEKLLPHSHKYMFFNVINASYNKEVSKSEYKEEFKESYFKQFLDEVTEGDKELIRLIQQIIGYTLSNLNTARCIFILYGCTGSGKSVLLNVITEILGKENVSHIDPQSFVRDDYVAKLQNMKANIVNEMTDKAFEDVGKLKSLVSMNDMVSARKLYGESFYFRNTAKMLMATNNIIQIERKVDQDYTALYDRFVIVPFDYAVPKEERDPYLIDKLLLEKDLIVHWAFKGLKSYVKNEYNFDSCKASEEALKLFKGEDSLDIIQEFIEENIILGSRVHFSDVKERFTEKMNECGKDVSERNFKELKNELLIKYKKFGVEYKKIRIGSANKYGFDGISLN